MYDKAKIDVKEGNSKERHCPIDDDDGSYWSMDHKQQFSQAGEDMASLISFDSLRSSSGSGSAEPPGHGHHPASRDIDPTLASLFNSSLSDEDILSTLVQWTSAGQAPLTPRYRQGCLPYLINLLHLHPLHTQAARPTRHIR